MAILCGIGNSLFFVLYQNINLPLSDAYFRGNSLLETNPLLCSSLYDFNDHSIYHTYYDTMHTNEKDLESFRSRQVFELRSGEFCRILQRT